MSEEIWRWIPGYPHYKVSNHGRVMSVRTGKSLTPRLNHYGYPMVKLCESGGRKYVAVHRLVAERFKPKTGPVVRHLDGVKTNNHVDNLQFGSVQENTLDTVRHGHHQLANRTHCKNGHPLTVAPYNPKRRECVICKRASARASTERKKLRLAAARER